VRNWRRGFSIADLRLPILYCIRAWVLHEARRHSLFGLRRLDAAFVPDELNRLPLYTAVSRLGTETEPTLRAFESILDGVKPPIGAPQF